MSKTETKYVEVSCSKCGETFKLDVDNLNQEQVEEWINADTKTGFSCPGGHIEICGPRSKYWTIHWDTLKEEVKVTEASWKADMCYEHGAIYDTEEMQIIFDASNISFFGGFAIVKDRNTGKEVTLNYTRSPDGTRYYWVY